MSTFLAQLNDLGHKLGLSFPVYGSGGVGSSGCQEWGGRYGGLLGAVPGSDTDWVKEVGDPSANSVVAGCRRWIIDNLPEPELKLKRRNAKGQERERFDHPFLDLLAQPNPYYDGDALLGALGWDYALSGNAYAIKERDNAGRVLALYYIPHWMIAPYRLNTPDAAFKEGYALRMDSRRAPEHVDTEDVIHFQWGLEPTTCGLTGVHRTMPAYRAIAALNEGSTYTHAILKNMGIVPVLVFLKKTLTDIQKQGLRNWWKGLFTRDGRGKPGFFEGEEVTVQELGSTPEKLALDKILQRPELAVCSAFGIHPSTVGLQAGGANALDNGGQAKQADQMSYRNCLMPMTKRFAKTLTAQLLLADYEPNLTARQFSAYFDFSDVEALSEDEDAKAKRICQDVKHGILGRREARVERGYPKQLPGEEELREGDNEPDDFAPVGGITAKALPEPAPADAEKDTEDGTDGEQPDDDGTDE